jgi:YidC/Oxa1 family membrane protein insertase
VEFFGDIWNLVIIQPMVNSLMLLYVVLFSNFGLAILGFTVLVRVLLVPLTIRQSRQLRAMTSLQPMLKQVQEKYAKDRQRLSQETMKIYKEQGVNPIGCLGPLVIQFPIWIGLFQALRTMLPESPEALIRLSGSLYSWLPMINEAIPINGEFLWLHLGQPDSTPALPILVGVSMWLMQKMTTMPSVDPRQASTNRMMLWMMPVMFGFFTFQFESGLALYWIVSNVIGIVIQGFITGWDPILSIAVFFKSPTSIFKTRPTEEQAGTTGTAPAPALVSSAEETVNHEDDRDYRQNNGRGNRNRPKGTRRRARGGRNRRR